MEIQEIPGDGNPLAPNPFAPNPFYRVLNDGGDEVGRVLDGSWTCPVWDDNDQPYDIHYAEFTAFPQFNGAPTMPPGKFESLDAAVEYVMQHGEPNVKPRPTKHYTFSEKMAMGW